MTVQSIPLNISPSEMTWVFLGPAGSPQILRYPSVTAFGTTVATFTVARLCRPVRTAARVGASIGCFLCSDGARLTDGANIQKMGEATMSGEVLVF